MTMAKLSLLISYLALGLLTSLMVCPLAWLNADDPETNNTDTSSITYVNLLHPRFIHSKLEACSELKGLTHRCNFSVKTLASQYEITHFDMVGAQSGLIKQNKSTQWKPELVNQYYGVKGEKLNLDAIRARPKPMSIAKISLEEMKDYLDSFLYDHQIEFEYLKGKFITIRSRDQVYYITVDGKLYYGSFESQIDRHYEAMVVSSMFVKLLSATETKVEFEWALIDETGRICFTNWTMEFGGHFKFYPSRLESEWNYRYTSSILMPFGPLANITKSLHGERDLVQVTPVIPSELREIARRNLYAAVNVSYIQAITPIHFINNNVTSDLASPIALCWVSSVIRSYKDEKEHGIYTDTMRCRWRGESVVKSIPLFQTGFRDIRFKAWHMTNLLSPNRSYIHLVYTKNYADPLDKNNPGSKHLLAKHQYLRCFFYKQFEPDKTFNETISLVQKQPHPNCTIDDIHIAPNDITELYESRDNGVCHSTIAIYDLVYTLHHIDQSILVPNENRTMPKPFEGLNVQVKAAFGIGNRLYLFAYSNTMFVVDVKFDEDCHGISMTEQSRLAAWDNWQFSSHFLLYNAWLKADENVEDYATIVEYQDFLENATDARPELKQRPKPSPTTTEPMTTTTEPTTASPNDTPRSHGSKYVIIAIGLILAAFIIAGIVYMFCMKNSTDEQNRGRRGIGHKSRREKSKRNPEELALANEMRVMTVRSNVDNQLAAKSANKSVVSAMRTQPLSATQKSSKSGQFKSALVSGASVGVPPPPRPPQPASGVNQATKSPASATGLPPPSAGAAQQGQATSAPRVISLKAEKKAKSPSSPGAKETLSPSANVPATMRGPAARSPRAAIKSFRSTKSAKSAKSPGPPRRSPPTARSPKVGSPKVGSPKVVSPKVKSKDSKGSSRSPPASKSPTRPASKNSLSPRSPIQSLASKKSVSSPKKV